MNWTCICAIPSPGPGPVRALKEVIICILPETYTFVSGFSLLLSAVCVCFSALHHCPWVAVLSCCSNVLAALADTHRWLSVYLLTCGLREQCRPLYPMLTD